MQIRIPGPVPDGLTLFETMRAEADGRILLLDLHLGRLRRGCDSLCFSLDEEEVREVLAGLPRGAALRARLSVDGAGRLHLVHAPLPPPAARWRVIVSAHRLRSDNPWLRIKSSRRPDYEAARAALPAAVDEAILLNERGEVCEGTITSLFLPRDGVMLTPALGSGLLPGVLRESLLASGQAREAVLAPGDLAGRDFFCGNALRGLIPARIA